MRRVASYRSVDRVREWKRGGQGTRAWSICIRGGQRRRGNPLGRLDALCCRFAGGRLAAEVEHHGRLTLIRPHGRGVFLYCANRGIRRPRLVHAYCANRGRVMAGGAAAESIPLEAGKDGCLLLGSPDLCLLGASQPRRRKVPLLPSEGHCRRPPWRKKLPPLPRIEDF
jgi:hypothetical protein